MPTLTQDITIDAPVEKVFAYLSDPKRSPTFVPGLNRISNLSDPEPKTGRQWEWEFNWFGLILSGKSECTAYEPSSLYQFQTKGGAASTWTYRCDPDDGKTRVTLEVDYEPPQSVVAQVAAGNMLERMNRNRATEALANLQALLEE